MSQSGSQAAAFFREVAEHRQVWWVRDDEGSPVPETGGGQRAFPYWSSEAGARRAADTWGGGLCPVSVPLDAWRWEFTVDEVVNRLRHALGEGQR